MILSASRGSHGECRARNRSSLSRGGDARAGAHRTRSQTAAGLPDEAIVGRGSCVRAGVLRFDSGEELFDAAELFESQPLPGGRRDRDREQLGGVARLAADACATRGLRSARRAGAQNPPVVGVGAGPDEYAASMRALLADAGVDALMAYYVDHPDGDPEAVLDAVAAVSAGEAKPIVASVVRADGELPVEERLGGAELLVPGVVCRRARACGRTSRVALATAGRGAAVPRSGPSGSTRGDRFDSPSRAPRRLALARAKSRTCWPPTESSAAASHRCRDLEPGPLRCPITDSHSGL